ncbi:hypothetical protein DFP73DRAFT_530777 [Morchella snyderi]|nr:hypothetical protein DFP73DRAFT_530777 [Morchella snyderi]
MRCGSECICLMILGVLGLVKFALNYMYKVEHLDRKSRPSDWLNACNLVRTNGLADRLENIGQVIFGLTGNFEAMGQSWALKKNAATGKISTQQASLTGDVLTTLVMTVPLDFPGFDKVSSLPKSSPGFSRRLPRFYSISYSFDCIRLEISYMHPTPFFTLKVFGP